MIKESKILLTDIRAGRNTEESIKKSISLLATAYFRYGMQRLAMNTFSLMESLADESEDRREPYTEIRDILRKVFLEEAEGAGDILNGKREELLREMRSLSRLTDAFGNYEYVLNRIEPEATGSVSDINTDELADAAFRFAFADQDKVVTSTRIQSIVAELPVRMSKQRFFDIISNSLMLYKGGDLSAAEDFAAAIREVFTDEKTGVFEEYPELLGTYKELAKVSGAETNLENYETARGLLTAATNFLEDGVSRNMLLTEVVNDALLVTLTKADVLPEYLNEKDKTAEEILKKSLAAEDIYQEAEDIDTLFLQLEGVQEELFDVLSRLTVMADDWKDYASDYPELAEKVARLNKAELFTSSSLYMDTERDFTVVGEEAGEDGILKIRSELFNDLNLAMEGMSKVMKRSCMARVLSLVPVFFNTKDEIREYFGKALGACSDRSELTAVKNILDMMILSETGE